MVTGAIQAKGFLTIRDPDTGDVLYEGSNAIHYENLSEALAYSLANKDQGTIFKMAFGNGGTSVDSSGVVSYLPTNTVGSSSTMYNMTYCKVIDDNDNPSNTDPTYNRVEVSHVSNKFYTDIVMYCLLSYSEPSGQAAFDNATNNDNLFVFDEIAILANFPGVNSDNENECVRDSKMLTHVIFHPIQKSLNRQFEIEYTIRIQTLTNLTNTQG